MSSPVNPESAAVQSYLNILQGIITRMATNSANCKTWCITLVSALIVLIADKGKTNLIPIALIPVLLFCFLDAYYLGQERAFREAYNEFVQRLHAPTPAPNDSNALIPATSADLFRVAPKRGFNVVNYTFSALKSFAIYPFYLSLLAMLAIVYLFLPK
jgi:hypothetical protein